MMTQKQGSRKVIVRLMGGLRNRMFQYSAALAFAPEIDAQDRVDFSFLGIKSGGDTMRSLVRLANSSKGVICASQHTKWMRVLGGVECDNPHIIRYSLDSEAIKPQGIPKTPFPSLVHFGRLAEKKHPIVTLEAFRLVHQRIPEARMTFIGSGHMAGALTERIERYGLSSVVDVIPGMQQNDALRIVESHWVFCQHSVTAIDGDQEGFSLSPAEAALLEMPVVTSFHNGIPEHVIHERTGLLAREFDFEGTAEHIILLLEDEKMRHDYGVRGRESVLTWCSPIKRRMALNDLIKT